jgi:GTP cyclohydrolase I
MTSTVGRSGPLSGAASAAHGRFDRARAEAAVRELLIACGEDPDRDGLRETPARVARSYRELFAGLYTDPESVLEKTFDESHEELILVTDIPMYSTCVPSKQIVNTVGGRKQAREVQVGDYFWTLVDGRVVDTEVVQVSSHKTRELVEVTTEKGRFQVTPDHPLATPRGWMEAKDVAGTHIEWTPARSLTRHRWYPQSGYEFGYVVGVVCSDGTVGANYVSLVVNDLAFAEKFVKALHYAFDIDAGAEYVTRPSVYLGRDLAGWRVRVVSSYLADLMRQYVGGDAHHMRQKFPRVVLNDEETFQGFLDGYIEGDGCREKRWAGAQITSKNVPFLEEIARVVGARFTPSRTQASHLYISDRWMQKHGFPQQSHRTDLVESRWVKVESVRPLRAEGAKPYTVYSYKCEPHPTFLIGGHLTHNCEHHLTVFHGVAHVGYIPNSGGRVTGLSKLARLVDLYAKRPQIQERLTAQIADALVNKLNPQGAIVVIEAEHLCMAMRGVRKPGARTTTSAVRGIFKTSATSRAEAIELIKGR